MNRAEGKAESSEEVSTGSRDDGSREQAVAVKGEKCQHTGHVLKEEKGSDTMRKRGAKRRRGFGPLRDV